MDYPTTKSTERRKNSAIMMRLMSLRTVLVRSCHRLSLLHFLWPPFPTTVQQVVQLQNAPALFCTLQVLPKISFRLPYNHWMCLLEIFSICRKIVINNYPKFTSTEGPRLKQILGLEKTRITRNFRQWHFRGSPTNAKIPHLGLHEPKIAVVGSMVEKTA